MSDTQLVDRIYECALVPELWPGVLDDLAKIGGAVGGTLFTFDRVGVKRFASSEILREALTKFAASDLIKKSQRLPRVLARRHAGFMTETATPEELAADPVYSELLHPNGLGWAAGTAFTMPTGDTLVVSVERLHAAGPPDEAILANLDILRPHIARAAFLAQRQHLAHARVASETLALIGLPTIVVDDAGKVLVANELVDGLKAHILWGAGDRFALSDPSADALLRQALATPDDGRDASTRSLVIRDADSRPALIAHVLPVRRSARDLFSKCMSLLVFTPVTMPQGPPVELVQSLFDLTPAEARVARSIAAGQTVDEIAGGGNVSQSTVRTQIKGVLGKTGCRRQSEVAALLGGLNLPRT